jgi:hypothetical protein
LKNKVGKFFENGHFKNVQNGEPTPKSSQKIDSKHNALNTKKIMQKMTA